ETVELRALWRGTEAQVRIAPYERTHACREIGPLRRHSLTVSERPIVCGARDTGSGELGAQSLVCPRHAVGSQRARCAAELPGDPQQPTGQPQGKRPAEVDPLR